VVVHATPVRQLIVDKSTDNPNIDTFILKRYPTFEGEGPYKEEVNGFRSVKHSDSINRCYGSYIHGNEFNMLLEYADKGSLEEYFQRESPPSRVVAWISSSSGKIFFN
jgi:serine/threonine protein kinase